MRFNRNTDIGIHREAIKIIRFATVVWGIGTILGITTVGFIAYLVIQALRKYIGG